MTPDDVKRILGLFNVNLPKGAEQRFLGDMSQVLETRHRDARLPLNDDSLAVAFFQEKTAALAFDRVYSIPTYNLDDPVPEEIAFYGATRPEMMMGAIGVVMASLDEQGLLQNFEPDHPVDQTQTAKNFETLVITVTKDIPTILGRSPTLLFDSEISYQRNLGGSGTEVLSGVISNLALVREADLSWKQVLEFRSDDDAKIKYLRLLRWLDAELLTRSPHEIEDTIALRLDDYHWAVNKHGLQTTLGTISRCLDPKFIGATSSVLVAGALTGDALLGTLAGSAIVVGQVAVGLRQEMIRRDDAIRGHKDYEIAFIHDVRTHLGSKQ